MSKSSGGGGNSHQRSKARAVQGSPDSTTAEAEGIRKLDSPSWRIVFREDVVISVLPAIVLAGVGAMVSEKYLVAAALYLIAGAWGVGCWWLLHRPSRQRSIVAAVLSLITLAWCGLSVWQSRNHVLSDVAFGLDAYMVTGGTNPILDHSLDIQNNSRYSVTTRAVKWHVNKVAANSGAALVANPDIWISNAFHEQILAPSGDGDSYYPFSRGITIPGDITCGDVTIRLEYSIEGSSSVQHKDWRFITRGVLSNLYWTKKPVGDKAIYCD